MLEINIYTDGACSQGVQEERPGGWGMYVQEEDLDFYGKEEKTTNNRMEMTAFFMALNYVVNKPYARINIHTDSAYISNCFKQKWYVNWEKNGWKNSKKQPVANRDLWEGILDLYRTCQSKNKEVNIIKVKGHSNDYGNNRADALAVKGREEAKLL